MTPPAKGTLVLVVALLAAPVGAADVTAPGTTTPGGRPLEFTADAFQHMERYFPMARVRKGSSVSPLPRGEALTEVTGRKGAIDLEKFNAENGSTGMLVVHKGKVRYEGYWQGASEATHFTSWSMAKSVTSTLVGIAAGEGKIRSVTDPIVDYVPDLAASAYKDVTIEQALQMSSGVKFDETYGSPASDVGRFMALGVRAGNANGFLTTLTERVEPPGTKFNYNTAETQVLGWVLRNATGKPVSTYLSEKIWQRVPMEDDADWFVDEPGGMEATGMGLNARLRDYARFGLLMLTDGVHDGLRVLPEGWVARATRPGAAHLMPGKLFAGYPLGYQYQWWVLPNGAFQAEGVFGQLLYIDPAHDLVVAKTSAWPEAWVNEREEAFHVVVDALIETLETARG